MTWKWHLKKNQQIFREFIGKKTKYFIQIEVMYLWNVIGALEAIWWSWKVNKNIRTDSKQIQQERWVKKEMIKYKRDPQNEENTREIIDNTKRNNFGIIEISDEKGKGEE